MRLDILAIRDEHTGSWEAAWGGGLSRRRASTRPTARAPTGVRGPLRCHGGPLLETFLPLEGLAGEPVICIRSVQVHGPGWKRRRYYPVQSTSNQRYFN